MMSSVSKRRKEGSRTKIKSMGDHKEFLKRITRTLYYGELPSLPCLSLPVTEVSCGVWSGAQRGRSVRRLHADAAARLARSACVSPCALVLALVYLERLHACNPHYLANATPHDLFLVSLMVGNKFLQDDGEDDEVFCSEWATSGGIDLKQLKKLEIEFLNAIDWNVFVSDSRFEEGLSWLEGRVADKQGRSRGFYTYGDLAALESAAAAALAARSALAALAGIALAYVTAVGALLATAFLASRAADLAPAHFSRLVSPSTSLDAPLVPTSHSAPAFVDNATVEFVTSLLAETQSEENEARLRCCSRWRLQTEQPAVRKEMVVESWWGHTSLLGWVYRGASVDPLQRWLQFAGAGPDTERGCVQWLNLSRLGTLMASVSDR